MDFVTNFLYLPDFSILCIIWEDYFVNKRLFIVKYFLVFTNQLRYLIDLRALIYWTDDVFYGFSPEVFIIWLGIVLFLEVDFVGTYNSPVSRWFATAVFGMFYHNIWWFSRFQTFVKYTRISRIFFELTHFHRGLVFNQAWGFIY